MKITLIETVVVILIFIILKSLVNIDFISFILGFIFPFIVEIISNFIRGLLNGK